MANEIFKDEILSEEELDQVAGGNTAQDTLDEHFFWILGYDTDNNSLDELFAQNGVKYNFRSSDNEYKIKVKGGWANHPHWAALGYVLSKRGYPGFDGDWTDASYVKPFLDKNFGLVASKL